MSSEKTSYHPHANHPWRGYRNRKTNGDEAVNVPAISLKNFLENIVENWDTYKIPPASFDDREYISLAKINPDKQAEWLISFIKKHWLNKQGALIFE